MEYGRTVGVVLVIAFVAGCATTTPPQSYFEEQDLPSAILETKIQKNASLQMKTSNLTDAKSTAMRNLQARKAIEYVDNKFYKFYEELVNKPETLDGPEQAYRIFQWVGSTAIAVLSWQAGQTDDADRSGSKNDNLARVGLTTAAAAALWAVIERFRSPKEDESNVILQLEKNRRAVSDCILEALGNKPVDEYSIFQVMEDADKYYRAGSSSTSDSVYVWKLNCS